MLSKEGGRHAPPCPGSEIRAQRHHRRSNSNPMLQPLPGWWDREGEVGEGGAMKMEQGRGLKLCHGPGVEVFLGLSVCMVSEGNVGGVSLEGE